MFVPMRIIGAKLWLLTYVRTTDNAYNSCEKHSGDRGLVINGWILPAWR